MASYQSLLNTGSVPDPIFHVLALKGLFSLPYELVCPHLDILIEEVASEHLLSVLSVESLGVKESISKHCLVDEMEALIVEEHIVIVKEKEGYNREVHHVVLEQRIINVKVSHIIIPLWVIWIQEHRVQWELWPNSLHDVKKVQHLFDGFISLLSHASIIIVGFSLLVLTYELGGCPHQLLKERLS